MTTGAGRCSASTHRHGLTMVRDSWTMLPNSGSHVRRARIGDEAVLRDLRLRAMLDAPDAFGSTYERELARTPSDWQKWLSPGVTFILDVGDGPKGIVAGVRDADVANVVHLMAMWVDPVLRGSGGADALAASVVSWARAEGARTVRLEVMESNRRARRFYERIGFQSHSREALPDRDGLSKVRMERQLVGP
jgi:ribosomal protein S18 acetylase RimI-like enzyme